MSKISLKPNDSGTANFEIAAPATNTDRTFTLPDEDGTLATVENIPAGYTDSDALDLFNVTGSAPVYACRAWVNFDGTGTVSIRESGNVSSITDIGTGDYTVNFATNMPDANYSVSGSVSYDKANWGNTFMLNASTYSSSQFRFKSQDNDSGNPSNSGYPLNDALVACAQVFR